MKKYYNYSPEIPNNDDNIEVVTSQEEKPQQEPVARRRRASRGRRSETAETAHEAQAKPEPKPDAKPAADRFFSGVREWLSSTVTRSVAGILLGGLGFWLAVAFFSYFGTCVADMSVVENVAPGAAVGVENDAGEGGARLTELLINQGFGVGAFVIVFWLLSMSLKLLVGYPKFRTLDFTIKSLIAFITLSVVVGMLCIGLETDVNWGGFHGRLINEKIYEFIGWSGAIILSVVLISIFVVICLRDMVKWIWRKKKVYDEKRRVQREAMEAERQKAEEVKEMEKREIEDQALSGEGAEMEAESPVAPAAESVAFDPESDTIFDLPDLEEEDMMSPTDSDLIANDPYSLEVFEESSRVSETVAEVPVSDQTDGVAQDSTASGTEVSYDYEPVREVAPSEPYVAPAVAAPAPASEEDLENVEEEKMIPSAGDPIEEEEAANESEETDHAEEDDDDDTGKDEPADVMTVNVNQIEKGSVNAPAASDYGLFTHEYKFPPAEYLVPGVEKISVDADEQMENKEKIRKTLLDFGIPITSIEATVGPTVTLYKIRPDKGVKIAKIRNLVDDLALSLAANGVRIIAPIPGEGTVGIEVANKDPQTVSMRTIIQSKAYQSTKYKLPVALGSTISNEVYIADLAKMPHLLVAGATGQGKSVGLNAIITSLLYSKRPEELKFVMVDPKRVEFSLYSKIEKYYLATIPDSTQPIITNMENVVATLSSLCVEMDERYKLLEKAFVRQVSEYNEKFRNKKLSPVEGHRFMPYIVVIIDEFADLIMTAGKEVELPIARLAQLARAVGIHVIIATQRPSTNVITGMIKANFPVRIAFKVSSGIDSKTILDSTGAQQLIGRGDMLISNNGEMTRVQCAFVDTPEVEEICDYIARQPYPQGAYLLPEPQMGGDSEGVEADPAALGKRDPLLPDVARQVVMSGTASTSAVQRRYEIGYNRAGRIMDQLEALGVVGPATGGKPRSVLMDAMSVEDLLESLGS